MLGHDSAEVSGLFMYLAVRVLMNICVCIHEGCRSGDRKPHSCHWGKCWWVSGCEMYMSSDAGVPLSGNHLKQHNPVPRVLNIPYFVCSFVKQPNDSVAFQGLFWGLEKGQRTRPIGSCFPVARVLTWQVVMNMYKRLQGS